jgi:hypothetical protein
MKLLLIILSLAAFVLAQEAAPAAAPAPAPEKKAEKKEKAAKVKTSELKGTVVSVDAVASTLTVKVKDAEEVISVDAATKVTVAGKKAALADLKTEVAVDCKVKEVDGKKVAVSVAQKGEKPAKAAKAKKEAAPAADAPAAAPAPAAK